MSCAKFLLAMMWLCGAVGGIDLRAATGTSTSQFSFDVWQVRGDLEQNPVTAVVQSREGYLWLGTYTGLLRFDGVRVTVFDSASTPGLLNSRVTSLYEDRDGVLWIGHETGDLTRLSGGGFRPMGRARGWVGGALEAIRTDENGDLWLLNDPGLLFRQRDGQVVEVPGGGAGNRKASLSRDHDGKLWITANGNVAILDQGQLVPFRFDITNGLTFFERVVPARDGGWWVMANGRLKKWREGRWAADLGDCPWERGFVTELLETRSGMLLAGTVKDGLYCSRLGANRRISPGPTVSPMIGSGLSAKTMREISGLALAAASMCCGLGKSKCLTLQMAGRDGRCCRLWSGQKATPGLALKEPACTISRDTAGPASPTTTAWPIPLCGRYWKRGGTSFLSARGVEG